MDNNVADFAEHLRKTKTKPKTHATGNGDEPGKRYGKGERYPYLNKEACRLRGQGMDVEAILTVLRVMNSANCEPPHDETELRRIAAGVENVEAKPRSEAVSVDGIPAHAEEILARTVAERHGETLRYTNQWQKWLIYDGRCWQSDVALRVETMVRRVCCEAASSCGNPVIAARLASNKTYNAVERVARITEPHHATADQWDDDPWLLNTPGGVINLKLSGENAFKLRAGRALDYCTKMTAATPGGDCPVFLRFLQETTGGDKELEAYLQMVFGYCLTGSMKVQVLFDIYGPPGTGKTTLVETISKVMGSYCESANIETFIEQQHTQHSTELARLKGARLVCTAETADGHFLAEKRVNSITGGSPVVARFLFQDNTTYMPQFKLLIEGNFRPRLKNPNAGIQRRIRLIPLNTPIAKRDDDLPEKLRLEYGGILAWQIEGCRKWQEADELKSPKAVVKATTEYLESEDSIGRWLDERTEKALPSFWSASSVLYADYKNWGEEGKEFVFNQKRFAQELERCEYTPSRVRAGRGFLGIKLLNGPVR